jgi:mono/diheme cytochrome c family protein
VKTCIAALSAMGVFLAVSLAFAAQEKEPRYKYKKDALVYAEIAKAPEKARAKRNPLEKDPDAVAAGSILFEQHCSECHGDAGEGGRKGPSLHAPEVQNSEPGAIFWILTNGVVRRGMPVWSKLPEPQRWQLVSFIKSLGVVSPRLKNPPSTAATPSPTASSLPRH